MASRSKSAAPSPKKRVKLFQQPTLTKEIGTHNFHPHDSGLNSLQTKLMSHEII